MKQLFYTCTALAFIAFMPTVSGREFNHSNTANTYQPAPLSFTENKGQITDQYGAVRKDIDVRMGAGGLNIFVGSGEVHYQWNDNVKGKRQNVKEERGGLFPAPNSECPTPNSTATETYRMDVVLVGADKNAELVKEEPQKYYETYYTPGTGENGALVHSYNRVVYKNVYPHIDWVLYSRDGELKYDFVIHPGGRVADIQLRYAGATRIELRDGAVVATTPMGSITEAAPVSYDGLTGAALASNYVLEGQTLRFEVQGNAESGIVIDPVLKWATYYGGSGNDVAFAVTVDTGANPYIAGKSQSSNNIATTGSYQQSLNGGDAFIAKFNEAGVRQWATYYGGTGNEVIYGLSASRDGHIYAAGTTQGSSTGIATAGAHQTAATINITGMLLKFNAAGQRIWGTYYGNNSAASQITVHDVHCDANNNILIVGYVLNTGATGIASTGAWQTTDGGAFVASFTSSGTRQWGTYYGPANNTYFEGVSCDGFGNIYACGSATQAAGISTTGSHQPVSGGGKDGLLVKFSPGGSRIWATYYGGTNDEYIEDVYASANGDVYITGMTGSTTGIASPGAYLTTFQGSPGATDILIARFNTLGVRQWGTYYGGNNADWAYGITMGPDGLLYLTGTTQSTYGIATPGAYKTSVTNGLGEAFLLSISPSGQPVYGTYYGVGTNGLGVECSKTGKIYFAGGGINITATPGSHQPNFGGGSNSGDGFLVQFETDTSVYLVDVVYLQQLCPNDTVKIVYDVTHPFRPGNVFTLQLSNSTGSFASPVNIATKTTQFGDTFKIAIPGTTPFGTGYRFRVIASTPADTTQDNGIDVRVSANPVKPVATASTPVCTGATLSLGATSGTGGVTWGWTGPDNFTSGIQNPTVSNLSLLNSGDYIVTADNNGCTSKDTITVNVAQTPANVVANNNSPICTGQTLNLTANSSTPGVAYSWSGPVTVPQVQNPSIPVFTLAANGVYTVTATLGNCSSSNTTTVVINQGPSVGMYVSPNDTICAGTVATFVAVAANVGANPVYTWTKNSVNVPGQTGLVWATAALVTGDVVAFHVSNVPICPISAVSSQPITMTVLPIVTTPSVSITSVPVKPLPGNTVTFTAHPVNGGPNPLYQWQRNGIDQVGATYTTWSATNLYPYDKISVNLTSDDPCAQVKAATSNEIEITFPVSVRNVNSHHTFQLYPNPNDGNFTIKGKTNNQEAVTVQIINAIGQTVYRATIVPQQQSIEHTLSVKLAAGVYLLKAGTETLRLVVE